MGEQHVELPHAEGVSGESPASASCQRSPRSSLGAVGDVYRRVHCRRRPDGDVLRLCGGVFLNDERKAGVAGVENRPFGAMRVGRDSSLSDDQRVDARSGASLADVTIGRDWECRSR